MRIISGYPAHPPNESHIYFQFFHVYMFFHADWDAVECTDWPAMLLPVVIQFTRPCNSSFWQQFGDTVHLLYVKRDSQF